MIDLHIHSTYSDGSYSVIELLKEAEQRKLEIISITDHDNVRAYEELKNIDIKKYFSGKIIPGCEFKCYFKEYNIPIELLGYGIDVDIIKSQEKPIGEIENRYLQYFKDVGNSIGLIFNKDLKINKDERKFGAAVFETEIFKYKENRKILDENNISIEPNFYRAAECNPKSIFYINEEKDFIKVDELIEKIHKANGIVFLAHPYMYPISKVEEMAETLINEYKIDGIECCYSTFTDEQKNNMLSLCKKYNIFSSGGSDFHGKLKPNIFMGIGKGNLQVEKSLVKDWITNIKNIIN